MSDKDVFIFGFILAILIYYILRYIINKKTTLDLPIFPERYYDDPLKTLVQAILAMCSIIVGIVMAMFFIGI